MGESLYLSEGTIVDADGTKNLKTGGHFDVGGILTTSVDEVFYYPSMMNGGAGRLTTNGVDRWAFDQTTPESVFFTVRMPQRWASFTTNVLWTKEAVASGNVAWQLSYRRTYFADSNAFSAKTATTIQSQAVPAAVGDRGYVQSLGGTIVTDPGGFVGDPSIVHCELARVPADAGDTYAGDASVILLGVIRIGLWP